MDYRSLLISIPLVLISLTVHEFFHAYIADKMGDPTAKYQGRMSLNPLVHLDLMGTLAIIITRRIGWAKPVPINSMNFNDRKKGIIATSLAGPLSNLALAMVFGIFFMGFYSLLRSQTLALNYNVATTILNILLNGVSINISLAIFNLIPLYPLDGSNVLIELLPPNIRTNIAIFLQRYSSIILIVLVITGAFSYILEPIIDFVIGILI